MRELVTTWTMLVLLSRIRYSNENYLFDKLPMYLLFQYHGHKCLHNLTISIENHEQKRHNIVNMLNYFISSRFKYAHLPQSMLYIFADCVSPSPVYNAVVIFAGPKRAQTNQTCSGLWLVQSDHVTWILDSDWCMCSDNPNMLGGRILANVY